MQLVFRLNEVESLDFGITKLNLKRVPKASSPVRIIYWLVKIGLFSALATLASTASAQPAVLDGAVVKIPVVQVFETAYRIDLALVPNSDPVIFDLIGAEELTNANVAEVSSFSDNVLTIPTIQVGDTNFRLELTLSNTSPIQFQLTGFSVNQEGEPPDALTFFQTNVSSQIINSRCVVCHVEGGVAANTGLIYERNGNNVDVANFDRLVAFINSRTDAQDYILSKASGGLSHGGGLQLASGGSDYNNLEAVISLITTGTSTNPVSAASLFNSVQLELNQDTLRRAAIILSGKAPTASEISSVQNRSIESLKAAIRDLMQGDGFHEFLVEGANDRLLIRGLTEDIPLSFCLSCFPLFTNIRVDLDLAAFNDHSQKYYRDAWIAEIIYGTTESPLELIAYVVENDLPYSEILTADYMMVNPRLNELFETGVVFDPIAPPTSFKPGKVRKMYADNWNTITEEVPEINAKRVIDPGMESFAWPHAGVLNSMSFLARYPTTPTNRNRARARWTYLHFLETDIERSAPRTTDPAALADTNNPTMNNPACTVCHAIMDPVAGTFQNWWDFGLYRFVNGTDSLDGDYKNPPDNSISPYQHGDTWYRDMREPGFEGKKAPNNANSLQWLAQEIVADPRFARAAVKFWWPSVIGTEVLYPPEVESDATYISQLAAYDAQNQTIQEIADRFTAGGMNLRDLLVDLFVSDWFRVERVESTESTLLAAHEFAQLGSEALLTPERLVKKTSNLTGYTWNNTPNPRLETYTPGLLRDDFGLFYGGIDSSSVTKRAAELTPLMTSLAMSLALESACPIAVKDFAIPDSKRKLFAGINNLTTPLSQGSMETLLSTTAATPTDIQFNVNLPAGNHELVVASVDGACFYNSATGSCSSTSYLSFLNYEVRTPGQSSGPRLPASYSRAISPKACASDAGTAGIHLYGACPIRLPINAPTAGTYTVVASVQGQSNGALSSLTDTIKVAVSVDTAQSAANSTAAGAIAIKQKIASLFQVLLGKTVTSDSSEVSDVYALFIDSWNARLNTDDSRNLQWIENLTCTPFEDRQIFDGLDYTGEAWTIEYLDDGYPNLRLTDQGFQYLQRLSYDPSNVKYAWTTVLTYFLSHYDYLFE